MSIQRLTVSLLTAAGLSLSLAACDDGGNEQSDAGQQQQQQSGVDIEKPNEQAQSGQGQSGETGGSSGADVDLPKAQGDDNPEQAAVPDADASSAQSGSQNDGVSVEPPNNAETQQ